MNTHLVQQTPPATTAPPNFDPSNPIPNVTPTIGPFSDVWQLVLLALGLTMAGVMAWCFARALIASAQMKLGLSNHNSVEADKGRKELAAALVSALGAGSMSAIFTIIWAMRLT